MDQEQKLRRVIHPEIKILDEKDGVVEYIASDESLDSYREIVRAAGWKFTRFAKNAPFVDSHNYWSIDSLVGKVLDWRLEAKRLIETVKWAIDVEENKLAQIGWKMTVGGYLKAVSVGFFPTRWVRHGDDGWQEALKDLDVPNEVGDRARLIFLEQEQIELSSCIIGANPNALARSFKAGVIGEEEIDFLAEEYGRRQIPNGEFRSPNGGEDGHRTKPDATGPSEAKRRLLEIAQRTIVRRQRTKFLARLNSTVSRT